MPKSEIQALIESARLDPDKIREADRKFWFNQGYLRRIHEELAETKARRPRGFFAWLLDL